MSSGIQTGRDEAGKPYVVYDDSQKPPYHRGGTRNFLRHRSKEEIEADIAAAYPHSAASPYRLSHSPPPGQPAQGAPEQNLQNQPRSSGKSLRISCLSCRTKKVKCDLNTHKQGTPPCTRCAQEGRDCIPGDDKRANNRGPYEAFDAYLHQHKRVEEAHALGVSQRFVPAARRNGVLARVFA